MHKILDQLEQKWRAVLAPYSPPLAIGGTQCFAWYENEDSQSVGVVVCIGSNYSQYPTKPHFPTKDRSLGTCFSSYCHAAKQIAGSWGSDWRLHSWLVNSSPPLNPRYFVMSNLVPWITSRPWTLLTEIQTHHLIHLAFPIATAYLDELAKELPDAFAVGHGIDDKILPYLPGAVSRWKSWMLYANLSRLQTPSAWSVSLNCFKF